MTQPLPSPRSLSLTQYGIRSHRSLIQNDGSNKIEIEL